MSTTTGSSSSGHWQASGPGPALSPGQLARALVTGARSAGRNAASGTIAGQGDRPTNLRSAASPVISAPGNPGPERCPRGAPDHGVRGPVSPGEGACTATLSGAVSAGSNPAGGTAQRHKFELWLSLPVECHPCGLRKITAAKQGSRSTVGNTRGRLPSGPIVTTTTGPVVNGCGLCSSLFPSNERDRVGLIAEGRACSDAGS